MIIKTDEEGKSVLEQLCDIALKQAVLRNLAAVNTVLASIELTEEEKNSNPGNKLAGRQTGRQNMTTFWRDTKVKFKAWL